MDVRPFLREPPTIKSRWFVFHPHSYGIATLMRVGLRLAGRQLLLHHFRPHEELEFHDHPWPFITLVLWGGYTDLSYGPDGELVRDVLRPGSVRYRPALHAHRTSTERGAVTLVVTGRKQRTWCKGDRENWVCGGEVADFDATRGMVKVRD